MTAKELIEKYAMTSHPENGAFVERHFVNTGNERASSGSMYYYVAPGEKTKFHVIDCDEYWCYVEGDTLDICSVSEAGEISYSKLGIDDEAEPLIYFKAGTIFASKSLKENKDGTFLICITVPRFSYDGFEIIEDEKMEQMYPDIEEFIRSV